MSDWDGKITVEYYEADPMKAHYPNLMKSGWVAKGGGASAWGTLPEDAVRTLMDQLVVKWLGGEEG